MTSHHNNLDKALEVTRQIGYAQANSLAQQGLPNLAAPGLPNPGRAKRKLLYQANTGRLMRITRPEVLCNGEEEVKPTAETKHAEPDRGRRRLACVVTR
jgi:hypothetical protein